MKLPNLLPPEDLKIRIPGETAERLRTIQSTRKENGASWALGELAATLLSAFLADPDLEGLEGTAKQPRKRGSQQSEIIGGGDV
jgi:hypothetical protein